MRTARTGQTQNNYTLYVGWAYHVYFVMNKFLSWKHNNNFNHINYGPTWHSSAKSSWSWICPTFLPGRTSSSECFAFLNAFICMFCVLLTRWKLKGSVLAISSRVNCIINSWAVKRQGMAGIHTWAFTFSRAQLSIVCVLVPDKTVSAYQKCHLLEEKQVMVGRDLSLCSLDIHRTHISRWEACC